MIPPVIRELQRTVSASRLNTFHQCRLKFFFRYVAEVEKPATPALFVGKAVHAVLQAWNIARWRGEERSVEFFRMALDAIWEESGASIKWKDEAAQRTTAWAMLQTYFHESPIPSDEKPQGVEVVLRAAIIAGDRGCTLSK
jgi:putative RecB family exonuclease